MTGRDYRTFLSLHRGGPREIARTSEQDKLMVRMTEGIGSSRYKQLDYEKLKAITFEKKFAANESLMKMERLAKVSKQSKEHHLLNQHKLVWQQEQSRLNHALQRANNELQVFMQDGTLEESSISTLMLEAEELQMQLAMDEKKFRAATIDPILNLKEDLGVWLQEHKAELEEGGREIYSDYERVQDTVESVKNQEEILLDRLSDEELRLQSDLDNTALQDLFTVHEKWVNDGIPEEAEDLECPDPCLKESVLQEFIFLDDRFREKLKEWDHRHQDILRSESGGWTDSDHYWFQVIIDQYPHEMTNRRMLYIDRMKRQLPHKSRAEVVAHEEWYSGHKYYHEHRKVLINSWIKSRKELLNKAHAVFADAFLAIELERIAAINRQRQKEICDQLYEKVKLWREEKMEEMKLQAEIEARRQQELNHEKKIQNEKDKKKRQEEKRKIGVYQSKLNAEREERQERDRKRLQELQIKLAEQAEYDKNRVEFRVQILNEKRQERLEQLERQAEAEIEKEQRLQALRDQVKVNIDYDPVRMMQATESSKAKLGIGTDEDVIIQKPLFEIQGFTTDQVVSDPRHRLEEALRSANLHNNPYARQMITAAKPIKPPRKDTESTIFKIDQNESR